ncbi:MAG: ABC transporter permease [Caulobacteraceae bacterium]
MRALNRKLLRDLWRLRWQVGAISLLIACAVAVAVMAFSTQESLKTARALDYAEARFADVFATAKRAPLPVARDLARIDGVTAVDARALKFGLMKVPGQLRPATVRLISLPDDEHHALNRIVLMQGRMPDPNRSDEAVGLKTFLDAAKVRLGDRLTMTVGGRQFTVRITGSALSAEFAYLPGPASQMPDDAHQAVLWAPRPVVEKVAGLGGAFSSVSLALAHGASAARVLPEVDRILAPYGGQPAIARKDQVSNQFQQEHIDQLGALALIIPPVFLIVAAGLVNLVLGRLVDTEREQIGLLKAFGYGDLAAAAPYLQLAGLIGLIGAAAGGALGGWIGGLVTDLFHRYVRFTHSATQFSWTAFAGASAVAVLAAMLGAALAVRRAARLSPAVAMKPAAPTVFRKGFLEGLPFWRSLDQPSRMIVRSLERYPARAALTVLGLAASLTLLVGTQFMFGSIDEVLDQAYFRARHWTDILGFAEARDPRAMTEIARLPGVVKAEPIRVVPVRARSGGHEEKAIVFALDKAAALTRPRDTADRPVPFEGRGLVMSDSLAARLRVDAGDTVEIEVYENRRPRLVLPITGVARDYAGLSIFMDRTELNRILGDGDVATSATLLLEPDRREAFYAAVERTPQVVAAVSRADTVAAFRSAMVQTLTTEMTFYLAFASAIAFGIAYNICRIDLAERGRDLATLRVLGFDQSECAYILVGEVVLLAVLAVPLGVLGGQGLAQLLVQAFQHQDLRLPAIITPEAYGRSVLTYILAVAVATALVTRRVWTLDLVAVLKTRE